MGVLWEDISFRSQLIIRDRSNSNWTGPRSMKPAHGPHASVDRRRDSSPPESYDGGRSDVGWADGTPAASKSTGVRDGRGRRRGAHRGRRRAGGRVQDNPRNPSLPREKLCFPSLRNAQTPFSKKEKMCFLRFRGSVSPPPHATLFSDIDSPPRRLQSSSIHRHGTGSALSSP
jgi:hypothetical protein